MTILELLESLIIALPIAIILCLRIYYDLQSKRGYNLYDKNNNKVGNFGDWLDGKEE